MDKDTLKERAVYLGLTALSPHTTDAFVKALRVPNLRMSAENLRSGLVAMSHAVPAPGVPGWVRDEVAVLRDAAADEGLILVPQTPDADQQRAFFEGTGYVSPGNGLGSHLNMFLLAPAAKKLPEVVSAVASGQVPVRPRRLVLGFVIGAFRFALLFAGTVLLAMLMVGFAKSFGTPVSVHYQIAALLTAFGLALLFGDARKPAKPLGFWGRVRELPKRFTLATVVLLALSGLFVLVINEQAIQHNEMMMQIEDTLRSIPDRPKTWEI